MKKTIGIVTMYAVNSNYGNRMQNYAVQTVLERMGFDTVTYSFEKRSMGAGQAARYLVHLLTGFRMSGSKDYWKADIPRSFAFRRFNREYIKTAWVRRIEDIGDRDFYVIGSDQVWNPVWYDDMVKHLYLLDFAAPEKKVCFSPSFGVEQLPEKWKPWFREKLEQFPMLSVREEAGARIIRELTGREARVLVDPTMLLTREDWRKAARQPKRAKEGFILTYFLSPKSEAAAGCLAGLREGKHVYELLNAEDPVAGTVGPSEFLWLFDHADLVLTDSFHACVFSFLFDKPFLVFDRNWDESNMNSRLETMLKKFHLERKYAGSQLKNDIWEHDYTEGYRQLELEREKAAAFLKASFEEKV